MEPAAINHALEINWAGDWADDVAEYIWLRQNPIYRLRPGSIIADLPRYPGRVIWTAQVQPASFPCSHVSQLEQQGQ